MKKLFTLLTMMLVTLMAQAQNGPMQFAGPSTFGVAAMNAWQDNERDVIIFQMNSTSDADITLPQLHYNAMNMTIPSFTIHGAKFAFDYTTHNAVFEQQTFSETVTVEGEEKTITGYALSATYEAATHAFSLTAEFSYGKMPVHVTYQINATYVKSETGIESLLPLTSSTQGEPLASTYFDLAGRQVRHPQAGHIYLVGGKKVRY